MFSIKTRTRRGVLALALALGIGTGAAAQTVVISSSGPSARNYPTGKSLAAGSRIVLSAGDSLTVLDSRGTRTLRGPLTTSAEAAAQRSNPSFASLVATQNRRRARTGAIRGSGESAKPSNLWQVNLASGGTVCITDPAAVQLWRPEMEKPATVTVTASSGQSSSAAFIVGQNATAWPKDLPIAEGREYTVSGGDMAAPTRLRFAMLDSPVNDPASTYAALDAKGCDGQKALLLGAMQSAE